MILGIDLGTTYSVGAYKDTSGHIQIIRNSDGDALTPSVVLFEDSKDVVVGECAKETAVIRPSDVISVVKNHMGKKEVLKNLDGRDYTPEMISSFIVRKIVTDAEKYVGESVEGVVITVPAYFSDAQRKATQDAASIAGVKLLGIINEPTAAALAYVNEYGITNETLLVYDLGGGTFDVTALSVDSEGNVRVISTGGLSNTGGRFFDQSIVDYVVGYFDKNCGIDLEDDEYEAELQELYLKAESAKKQLSAKQFTDIQIRVGSHRESIRISRDQFEEMISKVYLKTEGKIRATLAASELTPEEFDRIILIGGSSRIPYISKNLKALFGKEAVSNINPDEAVAIGAAIYGESIAKDNSKTSIIDVNSHSIGIAVTSRETGERENEIVIKKDSALPIEVSQNYRTIVNNQGCIDITITEGESKQISDISIIADYSLFLPKDCDIPSGTQVVVTIGMDKSQLVYIKVTIPSIEFEKQYVINRTANMSEEDVEKVTGIMRDYLVS